MVVDFVPSEFRFSSVFRSLFFVTAVQRAAHGGRAYQAGGHGRGGGICRRHLFRDKQGGSSWSEEAYQHKVVL